MREVALKVDREDFGFYLAANSAITYFGLSQLGLDLASSQKIAESLARNDEQGASRTFQQLTWFNRAISLILALSAFGFSLILMNTASDTRLSILGPWIICLTASGMAVRFLSNPATAALSGTQNVHVNAMVTLLSSLSTCLLAFVLLKVGTGVLCLPAAQAIVALVCLPTVHYFRMKHCAWSTKTTEKVWVGFKSLLCFSLSVAAVSVLAMVESSCEPWIFQICTKQGLEATAEYSMWMRFPSMTLIFVGALLGNSGPTLAANIESNRSEGFIFHRKLVLLSSALGCCSTLGLSLWLVPTMHHWLDGHYDLQSGPAVAGLMAASISCRAMLLAFSCLFYPLNRVGVIISGYVMLVFLKVGLGVLLVNESPVYQMSLANTLAVGSVVFFFASVIAVQVGYSKRVVAVALLAMSTVIFIGINLTQLTANWELRSLMLGIVCSVIVLSIALAGAFVSMFGGRKLGLARASQSKRLI